MKYLSIIFFVLLGFVIGIRGQSPSPPPPPLIYKAPAEASLKSFISSDQLFEVVFPGDPTFKLIETKDVDLETFRTIKDGSHSTVVVYKYKVELDANRANLYSVIRTNILKDPKAKIESESQIKNGSLDGMEFNFLSDYTYKRIRVFAKGKTFFMISCDVTNWHILSQHYPEIVKAFKDESERFLNSFKIK